MAKPVGGRGKQSPYPSKPMRVPEVLHPIVDELIENLYETGDVSSNKTCNGFNDNQGKEVREAIELWANRWMSKAEGKENQPRYKFLVDAIKELQSLIEN